MSEPGVRIDPLNPGQFFACCGLLELLTLRDPNTTGRFELDDLHPRIARFVLDTEDVPTRLKEVLERLKEYPAEFPDEDIQPPVRPAAISYDGSKLVLDWWLNEFRDDTENLKCWAGQVTTRNLFSELLPLLDEGSSTNDIFERSVMTKAKFGVDPRSAWNALDFGFSPNEHGRDSATFPAVEILAAIGLQGFRPDNRKREGIRYSLWQVPLPASIARLAFRAPWGGLPHRQYSFSIAKRGQSYKYFTFGMDSDKENAEG